MDKERIRDSGIKEICVQTDTPVRVDAYLSFHCEELTRAHIQKLVADGMVTVNGAAIKKGCKVKTGDVIQISVPAPVKAVAGPEKMELDIVYEDDDIVIVNKPKGMVVHPAAGHETGTLVNGLLEHCGESLSGINGVMRPGIVHRIDMNTTGLLVVCKNDEAHAKLAEQLKVHSITRKYYAIVHGVIKDDTGVIDAPIGRSPADRKKMAVTKKAVKRAVTHYRVLKRFEQYTYVECVLETGRTHQIRVHMKYIGHPLLGDDVYGPARCPFPALKGQTLHAGVLGIVHPTSGKYMEFEAPLPEYFQKLLKILK